MFLNYTAIIKILKKHEKLSSLDLKESYLARISPLSLARPEALTTLKKAALAHAATIAASQQIQQQSSQHANKRAKTGENDDAVVRHTDSEDVIKLKKKGDKVLVTLTGTQGTGIINCAMSVISKFDCLIQDVR